jgi:Type II CAAX prenyl endopeptidase Rce1-like
MSEVEARCIERLAAASEEVIRGNYRAAAEIFELTRANSCGNAASELAEIFGLMTVKVQAREHALEKTLAELRKKNADLKRAVQIRAEFAKLFSGTVLLLCIYAIAVSFLRNVMGVQMTALAWPTHLVNLGLFIMLGGLMVWFLRRHHYPVESFGVTWKNWRRAVAESLLACIPGLAALVVFKALLVQFSPLYQGKPVIEWSNWGPWQMFVVYGVVALAQEISTRGFMQTCIERVLPGKGRTRLAIVLAAAEFGVVHLHYSFALGMLAFFGAVLFGTLYARHRTIVGITIAHYILGQCIFGPLQLVH